MEFMRLWDTQVADGIVTFDEFAEFFSDVSASVESDEIFAEIVKNPWRLDA